MQTNGYNSLVQKIDEFIRKYYMNNLIRGSLHTLAGGLGLFIAFTLIEHYVFNSSVSSMELRKTLFYSFVGATVLMMAYWVVRPLVSYFKLGKVISHDRAAEIIGQHFSNVQDKLLNVLQLRRQASQYETDLLEASIEQKSKELSPVPFKAAIDLTENRKYLRLALPPVFLLLGLLVFSNIVQNSTHRLLLNNQEFEPKALFKIVLKNETPQVVQYDDYTLEVNVEGEALPQELFIEVDNLKYKLEKINNNTFIYKFTKLPRDTDFRLKAGKFTSKKYTIDVMEKPNIASFDIDIKYPSYTGRKNELVSNIGDLTVPAGTNLDWLFSAQNTDNIYIQFADGSREEATKSDEQNFAFSRRMLKDGQYKIKVANKNVPNGDSVTYTISVIPDMFPTIDVKSFQDSANMKMVYFAGDAADDYGIRGLNFHYELSRKNKIVAQKSIPVPIAKGKQTTYDYVLDVKTLDLQPGDKLTYYFQVFDNDAVQGSKSARTITMYYEVPTLEEIAQNEEDNNKDIKSDIDKSIKELQNLKNNINKTQNNILQKPNLNWQDRKELEKLIEQQKNVEENLKDAKEKLEENLKNQEEFNKDKIDPELLEKQEVLEKLFEEVLNDEMKKLFEELEKMLDKLDKEEIMENLKDMQMSNEEMQKELDRMMELFKQLEVEKDMKDALDQLDSLAKKQEELSKETEKAKDNPAKQEELKQKQDEINKEFEQIKEKLDKAAEKNEELENPMDIDKEDLKQDAKDVKENLEKSAKDLKKKENDAAKKSQKNAADKMKDMAKKAKDKMNKDSQEKKAEDLKSIRQLLENIVQLSFDQERLQEEIDKSLVTSPNYVKLVQQQYKIKDDFRHVEDSLQALAKRMFQLESFVMEKSTEIKKSVNESLKQLENRDKRPASVQQQRTMTSLNDLALMLSEAMEQTQQDMAEGMPGEQMCEKPGDGEEDGEGDGKGDGKGKGKKKGKGKGKGQGTPKLDGAGKTQEELRQQLEQMMKDAKDGKGAGSRQFAEMAAKQAAIRKAVQEYKKQLQEQGKGGKGGKELQDLIDQMEKVETDLVNKKVPNAETMRRQQDIVTRLLEAETAQREREFEEKRKSEKPQDYEPKMPPALEDYLRKRQAQVDMFKTVSPTLKPYYKNLVENYFDSLK